jgi:hypothetical protein
MTKSQQRELKAILAVLGQACRQGSVDDVLQVLIYRAQNIVDNSSTSADHASVRYAG